MVKAKSNQQSLIFSQIMAIIAASLLLASFFLLSLYLQIVWHYLFAQSSINLQAPIVREIKYFQSALEINLLFNLDPSIINPQTEQATVYHWVANDLDNLMIEPASLVDSLETSVYRPASPRDIKTFGDGFSSLAHINRELTNMYWDSQIGAFLFTPLASLNKVKDCGRGTCDFELPNFSTQQYCRASDCLRLADKQLFFNNRLVTLPTDLRANNILSIHLGLLTDRWLIGFILGENSEEAIWLYWFDGQNFSPLITKQTEFVINLKTSPYPGTLSFVGQPEDFLIVYGAYYSQVIHVYKQQFYDVSDFLPLTLTTRSFVPLVQQSARANSFYVCNYSPNNPRLLKLWRGDDGQIIGSVDLSRLLFTNLGVNRLLCLPASATEDLVVLLQIGNNWEQWRLFDQGFEQVSERQVTSKNINSSSRPVLAALASSLNIQTDKATSQAYQLFFSNNGQDFLASDYDTWSQLATEGSELQWQVKFLADSNPYYSPWFSSFSILNYELLPLGD